MEAKWAIERKNLEIEIDQLKNHLMGAESYIRELEEQLANLNNQYQISNNIFIQFLPSTKHTEATTVTSNKLWGKQDNKLLKWGTQCLLSNHLQARDLLLVDSIIKILFISIIENHSVSSSRFLFGSWLFLTSNIFLLKVRFKSTKNFSLNLSSPILVRTILLVDSIGVRVVKKSANSSTIFSLLRSLLMTFFLSVLVNLSKVILAI